MTRITPQVVLGSWIVAGILLFPACATQQTPTHRIFGTADETELEVAEGLPPNPQVTLVGSAELRTSCSPRSRVRIPATRELFEYVETTDGFQTVMSQVDVAEFWISTTKITLEQYFECVEIGLCHPPTDFEECVSTIADITERNRHYPITCVNWESAQRYCQWAGGRLPTSAEWTAATVGHPVRNSPISVPYLLPGPVCSDPTDASSVGVFNFLGNATEWTVDECEGEVEMRITRGVSPGTMDYIERNVLAYRGCSYSHRSGTPSESFRCVWDES